jgi:AmpD protein
MDSITINSAGIAEQARWIASPNFDARPQDAMVLAGNTPISLVVIHNISLPPGRYGGEGITQLFTNQLNPNEHPYYADIYTRKVSAHFLIRRSGELIQYVSCLHRAWHAGVSRWQGRERCNDFSVGIELEGSDFEAFEARQYEVLNRLLAALSNQYPVEAIVGHSDIAPGRKTDPGRFFDWSQLHNNFKNYLTSTAD